MGGTILAGIASDAAFLVMAPLGGAAFYAAGRHPLAGILAAFAANMMLVAAFLPSGIDIVLQGFTQKSAQLIDISYLVNPLSNWAFTAIAGLVTTGVCWAVIERVVEPRLAATPVDADAQDLPQARSPSPRENRALIIAVASCAAIIGVLVAIAAPVTSPFRASDGTLTGVGAPLMRSLVPMAFLLAAIPGAIYGYLSEYLQPTKT